MFNPENAFENSVYDKSPFSMSTEKIKEEYSQSRAYVIMTASDSS